MILCRVQTVGGQVWHVWQTRPHLCCAIDVTIFAQTIHCPPPLAWKGLTWEEGPRPAMHSQPTSHSSNLQSYQNEKIFEYRYWQNGYFERIFKGLFSFGKSYIVPQPWGSSGSSPLFCSNHISLFLSPSGVPGLNLEPLRLVESIRELVSGSTITRVIIPASSGLPPPRKSAIKWMPFLTNSAAKWSPAQKSARPDHQRSLTSSMQKQSLGRRG